MHVTLSRRNLLALLAKLDMPGSHRTIVKPGEIVVTAEPDEIVYAGRKPGRMDPQTEARINEMEEALRPILKATGNRPCCCCRGAARAKVLRDQATSIGPVGHTVAVALADRTRPLPIA